MVTTKLPSWLCSACGHCRVLMDFLVTMHHTHTIFRLCNIMSCVHVTCVRMYVQGHVPIGAQVCGNQGTSVEVPQAPVPFCCCLFRDGLSLARDLPNRLDWLVNRPQDLPVSASPAPGSQGHINRPGFFPGFWRLDSNPYIFEASTKQPVPAVA